MTEHLATSTGTPGNDMPNYHVAVIGPGAVGGLLAAVLARQGVRVTCIARPDTARAISERGISVRSEALGDFTVGVAAQDCLREEPDVCLVAVKAPALDELRRLAPPTVLQACPVVPLLNGVDHLSPLRDWYGEHNVVAATIRVEAARIGPDRIEHRTPFIRIDLGPTTSKVHDAMLHFRAVLSGCGVSVADGPSDAAVLWDKLAFLAPFALATAKYRAPIGFVREYQREELTSLIEETVPIARASGATVDVDSVIKFIQLLPSEMTSSLHRDLDAGAPDELDAIGGAVLRAASRLRRAAPTVEAYVRDLR